MRPVRAAFDIEVICPAHLAQAAFPYSGKGLPPRPFSLWGNVSALHRARTTTIGRPYGDTPLAKPNYSFEKRQREIAKKKQQEEKDARKREEREAAKAALDSAAKTPASDQ